METNNNKICDFNIYKKYTVVISLRPGAQGKAHFRLVINKFGLAIIGLYFNNSSRPTLDNIRMLH